MLPPVRSGDVMGEPGKKGNKPGPGLTSAPHGAEQVPCDESLFSKACG